MRCFILLALFFMTSLSQQTGATHSKSSTDANAGADKYPTINVHLPEPPDAADKQLLTDAQKWSRRALVDAENEVRKERAFLANTLATVAAQEGALTQIAESSLNNAVSS